MHRAGTVMRSSQCSSHETAFFFKTMIASIGRKLELTLYQEHYCEFRSIKPGTSGVNLQCSSPYFHFALRVPQHQMDKSIATALTFFVLLLCIQSECQIVGAKSTGKLYSWLEV